MCPARVVDLVGKFKQIPSDRPFLYSRRPASECGNRISLGRRSERLRSRFGQSRYQDHFRRNRHSRQWIAVDKAGRTIDTECGLVQQLGSRLRPRFLVASCGGWEPSQSGVECQARRRHLQRREVLCQVPLAFEPCIWSPRQLAAEWGLKSMDGTWCPPHGRL